MSYIPLSGPNLLLPWFSTDEEDFRFRKIVRNFLIAFVVLTIAIYFYPVPEKTREEKEALPPQLAKVILEKKELPKPPPKPKPQPKPKEQEPKPKEPEKKPEPKKPEPKPEPKPLPKPKPEPVKQPVKPQLTQQQKVEQARQQAANEVAQFQDALAEMRDLTVDTAATTNLSRGASDAKQVDRSVITQNAKAGSGGIQTSSLSKDTGGRALSGRETTKVSSDLEARKRAEDERRQRGVGTGGQQLISRSEEEIRKVIDRNKSAIDTTYQRALRKNPALEGRFVVKIVIQPNGRVSAASIVSSELGDDDLESKLLARIRLINFGTANVSATTVNYTFDFFPQ